MAIRAPESNKGTTWSLDYAEQLIRGTAKVKSRGIQTRKSAPWKGWPARFVMWLQKGGRFEGERIVRAGVIYLIGINDANKKINIQWALNRFEFIK